MAPVQVIMVGGFLGAGKTTLLWQTALRLINQGKRVGLITNDQAPDLVDTALLSRNGLNVQEVAGSCFCCDFEGLVEAAQKLKSSVNTDVLIADPVGSCTDLSSTILQPLKDKFSEDFILSPLSVLADPARLIDILYGEGRSLHESTAHIFKTQLDEADVIVLNKMDLMMPAQREELLRMLQISYPETPIHQLSALSGEGVDQWLEAVLSDTRSGQRLAMVDYDVYAEGEAVLGWLNASIQLSLQQAPPYSWENYCRELLAYLQGIFRKRNAAVGHVKLNLSSGNQGYVANLAQTDGEIFLRGELDGTPSEAQLVLNARVEMTPEELESHVRDALKVVSNGAIQVRIDTIRSISPGRPVPVYRYSRIVP